MENKRPVMQYESDIWAIADYFISAGIKQSDFPKFMMPFFALVMLESRMRKVIHKIEEEDGLTREDPEFAEAFRDEDCGYNAFIVEQGKMLADICKSDKTFEQDFKEYLQGFDDSIKMLLGINRSTSENKFLNIEGIVGELRGKKILLSVVKEWAKIDLEPYDNSEITTLEEHIKRKWADISAETAGEQYTPQDIIALISDIAEMMMQRPKNKYLHIYDPTCGGANLLFGVADRLKKSYPQIATYGSEWNDALYALAAIESRFRDESKIRYGNTLTEYPFADKEFDLVVANPPYGTPWKGFQKEISSDERGQFKFFPSTSDGQLLFMQHNLARLADDGICIEVHNGSSLFTGDAGSGESNIRKYMFERDWVDAIIQMPSDEFFNTNINTYLWIFNKNKPASHRDKVMLINASELYYPLKKSMGKKRRQIDPKDHAPLIVNALREYKDCEIGKVYDKWHFYYNSQSLTLIESDEFRGSVADTVCPELAPYEIKEVKEITLLEKENEATEQHFSKFQKLTDEEFATLEQALESWHADFGLACDTPEGQALYYKERSTGNFVYTLGDKVAFLGKGRLNWKFGHQKKAGTHSVKFFIEPLTQSDYEIIPYSPNEQENETNIQTFLDKYEVKKYIRKTNDVGVKINFNKEFYIPEDIPSIDKVINGITKTLEEIQAINEEGIIKVAKRGLRENVEMKSSPIGNIPSHWEIRRTKDVCKSIFTGATPSTSVDEYWDGDIPWLPSGCCHDCYITEAPKYITKAGLENSSTRWIPKGTTVMAITGATCAQLGSLKIDACANQSVVAFIEDKTKINARYLFYILRALRGEILTNRTGGAQAGIDTGDCMNILICVPPIDEQEEIVAFLEEQCSQLDKKYQLIDRQMKQLQLLKRSIVSEIVTGKRKIA